MNQTPNQTLQTSPTPPTPEASPERIDYLFRTSQRQGRIHPLLHLLQSYRAEQRAVDKALS